MLEVGGKLFRNRQMPHLGGGSFERSPSLDMGSHLKEIGLSASPININTKFEVSKGRERNLSFGNSSQVVYDIDGKFPYSYYESKPTLYDIDGLHRYKYYQAFKPTPYTGSAPHHEKQ